MPMTMVVTRDVEPRYRGFLASAMLEVAPGVYAAPAMTKGVRERIWTVLSEWWWGLGRGSIVMAWRNPSASGGIGLEMLGEPPKTILDADGVLLVKRL